MITRTIVDGKEWLKVIRMPRLKVLRAHLFGLTLGITALLTHLVIAYPGSIRSYFWFYWLMIGYSFGVTLALTYNNLTFRYVAWLHPEWAKLWFYYNPAQEVNIIKTPVPDLDWQNNPSRNLNRDELYKVFDHQPYGNMQDPYTIVFVANPVIEPRDSTDADPRCFRDPIVDNDALFLKAVERALFSFEFNEVVGRPDILSKIRIVTVNPSLRFQNIPKTPSPCAGTINSALVSEYRGTIETSRVAPAGSPSEAVPVGTFADRMLRCSDRVVPFVRQALNTQNIEGIRHIDVIFVLSASATHDMSTADASSEDDWSINLDGETFSFSIDPYCRKGDEILKNECERQLCGAPKNEVVEPCARSTRLRRISGPDRLMVHEYYPSPTRMGKVAMSVFDVRTKLPIHEFAHAMSSERNGHIVDEYFDYLLIREEGADQPQNNDPEYPPVGILVNRIYRNPVRMRTTHQVKIHNIFARYNGYIYESDRQHHSDKQGWYTYYPERRQREVLCTMDAAQDVFEFDELIRDFMYDRLWAKVNRGLHP